MIHSTVGILPALSLPHRRESIKLPVLFRARLA